MLAAPSAAGQQKLTRAHSAAAGTGTFSRVRIARHKASGKYTALKILKKVRLAQQPERWAAAAFPAARSLERDVPHMPLPEKR